MFVKSSVCLLLILAGSVAMAAATDIPGSSDVECSLSVENESIGVLEPVWLNVNCENRQMTAYTLLLGQGAQVGLRVQPPAAGKACWSTVSDDPCGGKKPSVTEIPPQGKASVRVLLNRWFRLPDAGKYSVSLVDCRGSREGEDPGVGALSPEVAFNVLPFDERRLAGVCDHLAQEALSGSGDQAREAAEALALIDSPEAVPYIKRVLDADVFTSFFVVSGLARINTPETTRILIEAFDKSSGFTRARVRDCLYQIKPQVDDPVLRNRLNLILDWTPQVVE